LLGSLWFNSFSAGAPAASDYELISTTVLGSNSASVTFSSLNTVAAAYKHLQIRMTTRTSSTAANEEIRYRINGDTSPSSYNSHYLFGTGSAVQSGSTFGETSGSGYVMFTYANNATSGAYGAGVWDLLDFSSTSKYKTARMLSGSNYILLGSSVWMSTAAVTSITLLTGANILAGSRFSLYGLK